LGEVGGRQVHHQTLGRQSQAQAGEGGAHPFAGLVHGLVAQADNGEGGQSAGELGLDLHPATIHTLECDGGRPRGHNPSLRRDISISVDVSMRRRRAVDVSVRDRRVDASVQKKNRI
jgi:hypothetical protein